ncbi:probable ATP-dependent RNA helicase DDX28 [Harmonia axyridis]|uniref:probable ATP-dependent RNA helicase DDX28 n=1 Tax=Harmonia axyridis TaxID=115357 RepID=UPI001E2768C4|nr:probable ATP-dependent RNA helicase DDX28 [Harmonia axyridis]
MQPNKIFQRLFRNTSTLHRRHILDKKENHCLISCKNQRLNHYVNTKYSNLEPIPLASKGWNHHKSKGDFFMINPIAEENEYKKPKIPFSQLNIMPELIKTLEKENIMKATSYQAEAIPELFENNHVLLGAETGCGKTICYLLPLLQTIASMKDSNNDALNSPRILVLVPSRELAFQIGEMANILAEPLDLKVKILTGGKIKKNMMNPHFEKIDILVATPGAIGKLSTVGIYKLQNVQHTVLDEADTLTDDSFDERISVLLRRVAQSRLVLVSATLPKYLPDSLKPIESALVEVISPEIHRPLLHVPQKFFRISRSGKVGQMLHIAKSNKEPLLIFTNRNETCNWLAMFLRENGLTCSNINGDMNYYIRIQQWNDFVEGKTRILSATDIGSRGLDTIDIKHVVNYEFPLHAADYLHRIGRVGRIGSPKDCKVTNLICGGQEITLLQEIEVCKVGY